MTQIETFLFLDKHKEVLLAVLEASSIDTGKIFDEDGKLDVLQVYVCSLKNLLVSVEGFIEWQTRQRQMTKEEEREALGWMTSEQVVTSQRV